MSCFATPQNGGRTGGKAEMCKKKRCVLLAALATAAGVLVLIFCFWRHFDCVGNQVTFQAIVEEARGAYIIVRGSDTRFQGRYAFMVSDHTVILRGGERVSADWLQADDFIEVTFLTIPGRPSVTESDPGGITNVSKVEILD